MEHRVGSPTDIESFVDAPGRKELVAEVRKKIDELGIEYLYLQFVSVTGRIMGKGIPADHWESIAKKGFQLVYGATMNLFVNRRGDYLGYGPEAAELIGIPEPETFMDAGFFDPAALFDAVDWAATPLGPRAGWARSLNAYLAQLMNSCRPLYLVWGPDRRFFYNEAFLPVMGVKHPAGFGQPMAEVWAEVWDEVGPLVASTIEEGKSHCFDDRPFVLRRHGHDELTYFSFAYTPVPDDDGDVSGLVCTLSERTKTIEEDEGRRSELHRLRALFQQAPGFVCVTQGEEHAADSSAASTCSANPFGEVVASSCTASTGPTHAGQPERQSQPSMSSRARCTSSCCRRHSGSLWPTPPGKLS